MRKIIVLILLLYLFTGCTKTRDDGDPEAASSTPASQTPSMENEETRVPSDGPGDKTNTADASGRFPASAPLSGHVAACSDTGCSVRANVTLSGTEIGDSTTAVMMEGDIVSVSYSDAAVFKTSTIHQGDSAPIATQADQRDVSAGAYVWVYGSEQKDGSFLATEIVVVTFI